MDGLTNPLTKETNELRQKMAWTSKSSQLVVPPLPQVVPSTPQIVPPMVEGRLFKDLFHISFARNKSKGKAKARALTAAELALLTATARNTRKRRMGGVEVEEETQIINDTRGDCCSKELVSKRI